MKVEVEELSPAVRRLDIEIPAEQVDDEIEEQFKEVQSKAQVPGFRPGKVPRKILERRFRKQIYELTMEELVKQTLETAMSRKSIKPLVEPVIDPSELAPGEPYKYSVHVEIKPEIDPVDYKGIEVSHKDEEVSEEDVDRAISSFQESASTIKEPDEDRPIREDDEEVTVTITAKDQAGEVLISGEEDEVDLSDEHWIPGLADKLVGRSKGQNLVFSEYFPQKDDDDEEELLFPEEFAGKTAYFEIKIETIKEKILPELNDDFAREYTKHESMEELRESIKESLMERTTQLNQDRMQEAVVNKILENNPVEVPPTLAKEEAKRRGRRFFKQRLGKEVSEDELESVLGMFQQEAERTYKITFLVEAIADKEGIEATEEEVEKKIIREAEMSGIHPDKFRDRLDEQTRKTLEQEVRLENTLDFLVREANISDKKEESGPEPDEEPAGEAVTEES